MNVIAFVLLLCSTWLNVGAYKILSVFPIPGKSHFLMGNALMEGLAEAGHEVTVIAPFQAKNSYKNYKSVVFDPSVLEFRKKVAKNNFMEYNNLSFWDVIMKWHDLFLLYANHSMLNENFQHFLKIKQDFDVIIIEPCSVDALYGIGQHFKAPIISLSALGPAKFITDLDGTPRFASYIPYVMNPYSDHMTFWQRMHNSLTFWCEDVAKKIYYNRIQEKVMRKAFPNTENWPSIETIKQNVSLILLNSHVTYSTARPHGPNVIEVGGMHIKKTPDPLTPNIKSFLDEANDGAIYISLGSNVMLNKLSKNQKDAILNAFSAFPNMRILVKSDEHIVFPSHSESNVLVESWFPQQSILQHKNVKVFVTHGGMNSAAEAAIFGKPVVGLPCIADQHSNMQIAESKGHGITVPIETLNSHNFKAAVEAVIQDPKYVKQAKLTSERYRDLQENPLEKAIHWVEHVAKNKGAPHLRSVAVDLPFFVLYNLDVWTVLFTMVIFIAIILYSVIRRIIAAIAYVDKMKRKTA